MYDRLKSLWVSGQLNEAGLGRAVEKGWITDEEKAAILATPKS